MSTPSGFASLDRFLEKNDKFIISTHESPDVDGLGAEIAFRELLTGLGKEAYILNSDPTPDKYLFLDPESLIHVFSGEESLPGDVTEYAVFVLDTNDFDNIGHAYTTIKDRIRDVFIIDHHEGGGDKIGSNLITVAASSASEIIYSLFLHFKMMPGFNSAQALFAGTVFDTGSFRYPKTSPATFRMAAHLVELGVRPNIVYERIYETNSLSSFELRALILSTMEVHFNGRLITMKLTPDMIRRSGSSFAEGELAINMPLTIQGVVASLLIKQDFNGPVKVSMRTKGDLNVADIAIANGGGGHKNAAGYKSRLPFDETLKKAISDMETFFTGS